MYEILGIIGDFDVVTFAIHSSSIPLYLFTQRCLFYGGGYTQAKIIGWATPDGGGRGTGCHGLFGGLHFGWGVQCRLGM